MLIYGFPCGSAGEESISMWETRVQPLGWEDPLEKGTATHSSMNFHGGSAGKVSAFTVGAWVQSLGQEDLLEKEMATHSSILVWKIPWMEKPGRLQFMGWQRVRHN